ncbi:MAG: hypothetical protein ACE37F_02465 [Nannocystaceae bacterium]|nr:hypothetical protein [bacterium]
MRRAGALLALCLAACGPDYGGLAIEVEGAALPGDAVEPRRVSLVLGHVVRVHARPRSLSAQVYEDPKRFDLASADETIGRVYRDAEDWRWVIVARSVGTTCLEVLIDGRREECVELEVEAEAG